MRREHWHNRRNSLGGTLDVRALELLAGRDATEYNRRANTYRPRSAAAMAAEVIRLRRTGLSVMDVAQALRLAPDSVANIITAAQPVPAPAEQRSTPC